MTLHDIEWKEFDLEMIFPTIQRGKRLKNEDHVKGKRPYVSSTAFNNGVDDFIANTDGVRVFRHCLTVANSGSVGACFYHDYEFVASDHVTVLINDRFDKYIYTFIATVVNRLSAKYSYNREINDMRIRRERLLLPSAENGEPNYDFMRLYMQRVEHVLRDKYSQVLSDSLA